MSRYKKLSHDVKCILLFNEWLMWSLRCDEDFNTNYYDEYKNLRYWCVDTICNLGLSYSDIPQVNQSNQNKIFKQSRKLMNLDSFKNISTSDFRLKICDDKIKPEIDKTL